MQISKLGVSRRLKQKIYQSLYQVLADLKRPEAVEKLFNDIFSETERVAVTKRLAIAWYLKQNKSYETIKRELKVSSATIATIQNLMEKNNEGISLALRSIEADQWAETLADKISAKIASWQKSFTPPLPRPM